MSMIPLAAALIRRATAEESFAQDLHEAIADADVFDGLVNAPIEDDDLRWLAPVEWRWFALWRQGLRGPLDRRLLEHLEHAAASSRSARFELRGLVMRDPHVEEVARSGELGEDAGLLWLRDHAYAFPDSEEVARDALQFATEASWYVLRVLTASEHPHAAQVRAMLTAFADARGIDAEVARMWIADEGPAPVRPTDLSGFLGARLARVADSLSGTMARIAARLVPEAVLGDEAPDEDRQPIAVVLPEGAEGLLAMDLQTRALFGGGTLTVWMSGRWIPPAGSRVELHAADSTGVRTAADRIPQDPGRLRFALEWSDPEPPTELLLAIFDA